MPQQVMPWTGLLLMFGCICWLAKECETRINFKKQDSQPGKEYLMHPTPQHVLKDYIPSHKLRGKVALVTGGDSGIGRSACEYFALEGATVAFTFVKGHEERDAEDTLEMLRKHYKMSSSDAAMGPIAIATDDLGFDDNCRRVVEQVVSEFGKIDVVVNNGAEQHKANSVEDINQQRLERVFRTNIFSYFFITRHALKHMKEGSCIINTTSVTAYKGEASMVDYAATKGAIVAFTRSLALQLIDRGIRVNGVAPGPVWTPLIPASLDDVVEFGSQVQMKRAAQPSEIGPAYVFLASNVDSSYFTGQVLHPNGGEIVNG